MARIVNRTEVGLEVYGADGNDGLLKRWVLAPGMETETTFVCSELRAAQGERIEILGSSGWWKVQTNLAFVYLRHRGIFADDLSLHCVPFRPISGSSPPWDVGYIPAPADPVRDAAPMSPSDGLQREPLIEQGEHEGELGPLEDATFDFGIQVRSRIGTDVYISVRLEANPSWFLSKAERELLEPPNGGETMYVKWKRKIEQTWNTMTLQNGTRVPSSSRGLTLQFECDWVSAGAHYKIDILSAGGQFPQNLVAPSTMYFWAIDIDDAETPSGTPLPDFWASSAHEFGHYLGLDDGYIDNHELPDLYQDDKIKALVNPDSPRVAALLKQGLVQKSAGFWATVVSAFTSERAAERLSKPEETTPADLMDDQFRTVNGQHAPIVDQELIDSILDRHVQELRYRLEQFFRQPK